MTPCVVFQVSQPYSSTDLTFELKSLIFVEIEILDAFHITRDRKYMSLNRGVVLPRFSRWRPEL